MENLTKQQIVLLTLLVSFVTSIATGIVTVSLMDQAPPSFTQTVNRIVERTVEKAVPVQSASVIQSQTVIVKEDSLVTGAIEKNKNNVVRISATGIDSAIETFLSLGTIISSDGIIATDASAVYGNSNFTITFGDGAKLSAKYLTDPGNNNIALLKITASATSTTPISGSKPRKFGAVTFGDSDALKLGQSVIAIGGQSANNVASGIISGFSVDNNLADTASTTSPVRNGIDTSLVLKGSGEGGPLLDLDGNTIAIRTGIGSEMVYVPINLVKNQLDQALSTSTPAGH